MADAALAGHDRFAFGTYQHFPSPSLPLAVVSNDISQIVPKLLTELEREDIIKYFKNMSQAERDKSKHFEFVRPKKPTLFVKYGDNDLLDEASTQSFFHTLA